MSFFTSKDRQYYIKKTDLELILHEFTPGKLVEFITANKVVVVQKKSDEFIRKEVGPGVVCLLLSTKAKQDLGFQAVEFELLHDDEIFLYYTTINPFQLLKINPDK